MSQDQPRKNNLIPIIIWLFAAVVGVVTIINTLALVGVISYLFGTGA